MEGVGRLKEGGAGNYEDKGEEIDEQQDRRDGGGQYERRGDERGVCRKVDKGREVALGLDLKNSNQQLKPSAGASLNVAQRATSRLVC